MITSRLLFLTINLLLLTNATLSCSMFKITQHGRTMVGNNEDAWRTNSSIWFEQGTNGKYGAAYVGHEDLFPQGGINEAGLVYDGFTVYPRTLKPAIGKLKIDNPALFMKALMQHCKSAGDVQQFAGKYDRSFFNNAVFLFVDSTGKYLVMEADTMIIGEDAKYLISNFCPSTVDNPDNIKIGRYQRGREFLKHHAEASLSFSVSMMKAMHECRNKIGDGTTYTTLYDLERGDIILYFYHDFTHPVVFNLRKELQKGNHRLAISSLFPFNWEYNKFLNFKTPFNSNILKLILYFIELLLGLLILCWSVYIIRGMIAGRGRLQVGYAVLLMIFINLGLMFYLFVLLTNQPIFYFDAPYYIEGKSVLNACAYIPGALLVLLVPVGLENVVILKQPFRSRFSKMLFTFNTVVYLILLLLFAYWGLLNVIPGNLK